MLEPLDQWHGGVHRSLPWRRTTDVEFLVTPCVSPCTSEHRRRSRRFRQCVSAPAEATNFTLSYAGNPFDGSTMIRSRYLLVVFALLAPAACGGSSSAELSAPRTLRQDQRPTVWDADAKQRLGLSDMRGETRWVGQTPPGWEERPRGQFRDAAWRVMNSPETDCAFSAGIGGGVVGNLTRWYSQQFGMAQVPAAESLEVIELAGKTGRLAELRGTFNNKPGWAGLIAFSWQGDVVTSLKFTGPEAVVMQHRADFLALAKSIRRATVSSDPKAPPIERGASMPPNHPPVGGEPPTAASPGASVPAPSAGASPFTGTTPSGWTIKAGSNRFLHHTVGGGGEVYAGQLGGNLKAMLEIWRGEMGQQQPLSDAEVAAMPRVAFLGEDSVLLDLAGNFQSMTGKQIQGARMLVAARDVSGSIVFVKLFGPAADIDGQVDAFRQFCGSVRRSQ
jgi:hypothetical protein